jgi:hypothetical protein
VPQKGTFAATAATHNNENIAPVDRKRQITLNHETAESHREVFDRDMGVVIGFTVRHDYSVTLNAQIA